MEENREKFLNKQSEYEEKKPNAFWEKVKNFFKRITSFKLQSIGQKRIEQIKQEQIEKGNIKPYYPDSPKRTIVTPDGKVYEEKDGKVKEKNEDIPNNDSQFTYKRLGRIDDVGIKKHLEAFLITKLNNGVTLWRDIFFTNAFEKDYDENARNVERDEEYKQCAKGLVDEKNLIEAAKNREGYLGRVRPNGFKYEIDTDMDNIVGMDILKEDMKRFKQHYLPTVPAGKNILQANGLEDRKEERGR